MNRYRKGLLWLVLFAFLGCKDGAESAELNVDCNDGLCAFNDFPDSLFNGIYWGQKLTDAMYDLDKWGFQLVDSSGAYTYFSQSDSTSVIIDDVYKVRHLKLILKSADYLSSERRLLYEFAQHAVSVQQAPEFLIFQYDSDSFDFKLTVFTQQDFIRLNFEQQIHR